MMLGPAYRGPSILSKSLCSVSCSPWMLRAAEMGPTLETKVVSYSDAGGSVNQRVNRKYKLGRAFWAAQSKSTGLQTRAWGKCSSLSFSSRGPANMTLGCWQTQRMLLRLKWASCAASRGLQKTVAQKG